MHRLHRSGPPFSTFVLLFSCAFPLGSPARAAEPSLWDRIETPVRAAPSDTGADTGANAADAPGLKEDEPPPLDPEAERASEELERARTDESLFAALARQSEPSLEFYRDPLATLATDPLHLDLVDISEFDIPMVVNDDVIRWLDYFTGRGRKWYARWLSRSTAVRPLMWERLEAAGLPRDLVYLSMIESGYSTAAYSRAKAAGLWQFIPSTGRLYKLRVDSWVDERRDPERSTDAAIAFLGDLHRQYGDWYLAWAAYNAGPGRVNKGVSRYGTKDFWTLAKKNAFRSETDNYVPKLLAAAIIGKHPERYGFTGIEYEDALDRDTVTVGPSFGADVLAKCAGIPEEEFRGLNPHLTQGTTPPDVKGQWIHVPRGGGEAFLAAVSLVPPEERITYQRHTVRKGETLGTIARKYGVSVSDLQRQNKIKNANRISPGMALVIPQHGRVAEPAPEKPAPEKTAHAKAAPAKSVAKASGTTHTVKSGETLAAIAAKYGVEVSAMQSLNDLHDADEIRAGQKLEVPASGAQSKSEEWVRYTVRKGDTLSTIADRHECSVAQLKDWNDLRGSKIYAGQKLKVRRA